MTDSPSLAAGTPGHGDVNRRDFLNLAATAVVGVGVAATGWAFIESMNPSGDVLAAGAPLDVDLGPITAGQQIIVVWRGKPIFIVNRTPAALKSLQNPALLSRLRDPDSKEHQQPGYADNWHRSIKENYLVLVGICTHLGCVPEYKPDPNATDPVPDWLGGYFCPCHGSKYDLAGRVFAGVPAPYNLPVPPYNYLSDTHIRIGENPTGQSYDLGSVEQI